MLIAIISYLGIYTVWIGRIVVLGLNRQRKKELEYASEKGVSPNEITVLIPFRNEEKRISGLLKSIKNLKRLPNTCVFIDDHSTDATVKLIEESLKGIPFEIISLKEGEGKKMAIRAGAKQVQTEYTLTWDADVCVGPNYFEYLSSLEEADMYVLPAIFDSKSFTEHLYEFDVVLGNAFNVGVSGWKRPIFASGANLLFKTETFNTLDDIDSHVHISSGDDTFLLRDFFRSNADVRLHSSPDVAVQTESPKSFREYINQRLRWIGKTNALNDKLNTGIAYMQLLFTLAFIGLLITSCILGLWLLLVPLIAGKIIVDLLLFYPYFNRINRLRTFALLPIAELSFPLLSIILVVLMPFYSPKWKGRTIINK